MVTRVQVEGGSKASGRGRQVVKMAGLAEACPSVVQVLWARQRGSWSGGESIY